MGTGRVVVPDDKDRQTLRSALDSFTGALHRVAEALGKVGRQ